jgi:ABC-type phosphate/phosphonate transport system substrate-binding protein
MTAITTTSRKNLRHQAKQSAKRVVRLARCFLAVVASFGLLFQASTAMANDAANPAPKTAYRLGVFPYLPALTIDRIYGPMAEAFSLELNRLVKLRTKSTFENFQDAIVEQSYDLLFVHPFFFVDAVDHHGYLPLARLNRPLRAVLVAAEDSATVGIEDLVGSTIGLPPKLAAVSHLIKSALMEAGIRPGLDVGTRHFRNKASCLQAVHSGAIAACGVPAFILSDVSAFAEQPLRTIFEAPPVNHFAFAVHNRVPEEERNRLKALILAWNQEGNGTKKLEFAPISDDDYVSIRDKKTRLQTLALR